MAPKRGSELKVRKNGTTIAGVQTKTITMASEGIDITSDDDTAFRTFMSGAAGNETIEIAVDGVSKDAILRDIAFNPTADKLLTDITILFEDGATLSGNFRLNPWTYKGERAGAIMFECTFQSSGSWTFTPSP